MESESSTGLIHLDNGRSVDPTIFEIWALDPTIPFSIDGGIPDEWDKESVERVVEANGV